MAMQALADAGWLSQDESKAPKAGESKKDYCARILVGGSAAAAGEGKDATGVEAAVRDYLLPRLSFFKEGLEAGEVDEERVEEYEEEVMEFLSWLGLIGPGAGESTDPMPASLTPRGSVSNKRTRSPDLVSFLPSLSHYSLLIAHYSLLITHSSLLSTTHNYL